MSEREPDGRFAKGNKIAVGNEGGAPRTVTPEDDELIELGEEMIRWVVENNPLHINQWYTLEKHMIYNEFQTIIAKPVFKRYYEKALTLIGSNYLDKNSNVRDCVVPRWQRHYFKDLKKEEDVDAKEKVKMAQEIQETAGQISTDQLREALKKIKDEIAGTSSA